MRKQYSFGNFNKEKEHNESSNYEEDSSVSADEESKSKQISSDYPP